MVTVHIVCVGKLKEKYWQSACDEYAKRLRPFCKFEIIELPEYRLPNDPSEAEIQAGLEAEGRKILETVGNGVCIPLCIEGKTMTSPQLAKTIEKLTLDGISEISFVIGSSFGLWEQVKQMGKVRLSMSPMTFPHQLARVMLCEQIYRSFQILNHGKYHK
ncbi:MAG: 23S rRNA (pseudouridine(1915)-N(3))-methyltransferase RlmH [Oscillospiraceae bacterium]|nr:23S rRNA (pseudouridine(1915)-N(3))-methyltransferase RlmH [Oscillospiraceae bacterium]